MGAITPTFENSYADFGWKRSFQQVKHHLQQRSETEKHMRVLLDQVKVAEARMVAHNDGKPIANMDILEIGPGQGLERATYFGRNNKITGLDTDIIARGLEWKSYFQMLRTNGLGRVAKTLGRELLSNRPNRAAWRKLLGVKKLNFPASTYGNICETVPKPNHYDMVMTWSVFEHVSDPAAALDNVLASLKPGGIFYISLHLYTCDNGHHDMRSFTGDTSLPLWGHLRPSQQHLIKPSAYLNEWRLAQWRELLEEKVPDYEEVLEKFEHPEVFGPKLQGALREELADYSDEELLTVNAVYIGRKK